MQIAGTRNVYDILIIGKVLGYMGECVCRAHVAIRFMQLDLQWLVAFQLLSICRRFVLYTLFQKSNLYKILFDFFKNSIFAHLVSPFSMYLNSYRLVSAKDDNCGEIFAKLFSSCICETKFFHAIKNKTCCSFHYVCFVYIVDVVAQCYTHTHTFTEHSLFGLPGS